MRFLSAQDYTPLNKLRHMQQVGVVLVIFSDNFKKHLTQQMVKRGVVSSPDDLDEVTAGKSIEGFVSELMGDLVPKLVEKHKARPPDVMTRVAPGQQLGQIVVKIKN